MLFENLYLALNACFYFSFVFLFKFFEGDVIEFDPADEEVCGLDTLIALVEGVNCTPVLLTPVTLVVAPHVAHEDRKLLLLDQAIAVLVVSAPER